VQAVDFFYQNTYQNQKFSTFAHLIERVKTISFHIENIGSFLITRRKGLKRLSMRIKPDGLVSISCPWFVTDNEVNAFISSNTDWIMKHQKKVAERKVYYEIGQTICTKCHVIELVQIEKGSTRAAIKGEKVVVTIPQEKEVKSEQIQQFIKKVIVEICRKEAQSLLPQRVNLLAAKHEFKYQKVYIKNLKSKWGSCSNMGNINLNVHLMRLPDHLIDYIILHELCHTLQMNHGPQFWGLLNTVTFGKAQQLDKEMKNYHGFFF